MFPSVPLHLLVFFVFFAFHRISSYCILLTFLRISSYVFVFGCISLYFSVCLCILLWFFVFLRISSHLVVFPRVLLHFLVFLRICLYFFVLLRSSLYVVVLPYISLYFFVFICMSSNALHLSYFVVFELFAFHRIVFGFSVFLCMSLHVFGIHCISPYVVLQHGKT